MTEATTPEPPDPYPYDQTADVTTTSMLWVQNLIRERLRLTATTATSLSTTLGGDPSTWRNKLNGTREFRFEDLLRISMALDGDLFADLPFTATSLSEYFPPAFRAHLSHNNTGHGMPSFVTTRPTWETAALTLGSWLVDEASARRSWLLTSRGITREVLTLLETTGLPSTEAMLAATTDSAITLDWLAQDTRVHIAVPLDPTTSPASSEQARNVLVETATALLDLSGSTINNKALVLVAPTQVVGTLVSALDLSGDVSTQWTTVSVTELHRLGTPVPSGALPADVHVQLNGLNLHAGLIWLSLK